MLWRFLENDDIPLTGELFRQRLLSLLETAKLLSINPYKWLKSVIQACIDRTDQFQNNCSTMCQSRVGEQLRYIC